MLTALERGLEGRKWFSLNDKVRSERTLRIAWEKVRSNAGACGVDRMSVSTFCKDSQTRLLAVQERLKKDEYHPLSILRVYISKLGSAAKRPLGIPAVVDRVVQTAVKEVIGPIFEREYAPNSHGFRPGRDCKTALREVDRLLRSGYVHVVDVDIQGYFDNIPHEPVMELVRKRIGDRRVLRLLEGFLRQKVQYGEEEFVPEKGTPQGGVISPMLANLYLTPLDWLMKELGFEYVRYADDLVVLAKSAEEARAALERLRSWAAEAQLTLHPEKTRVVDMREARAYFDFLGYRFLRTAKGKLIRLVRPKSLKKLRTVLKLETQRNNGKSLEEIIQRINRRLRGWFNYFKHAHRSEHEQLDSWVRMRLRSILRKRRGRKGRERFRDHIRWPNRYFENLGLFFLGQARAELVSLR